MEYIKRALEANIKKKMFGNNVLIIYGPRQVGKSTMIKHILKKTKKSFYMDCELLANKRLLTTFDERTIHSAFSGANLVVFDEAQTIPKVGQLLKVLFDTYPKIQFVATGSSSFSLAQQIGEPLVGRAWEFTLHPFGITELYSNWFAAYKELKNHLEFGFYPEIITLAQDEKIRKLSTLVSQYLSKDLLMFEGIRNAALIQDLLSLLAFQIGQEVSYYELAQKLQTSSQTVARYLDILEKMFIIFRLTPYHGNLRNEIRNKCKIYFFDLGARNALINQFNFVDEKSRNDIGALWENFCIVERIKTHSYNDQIPRRYFWRNRGSEIDYIEDHGGKLQTYEFKWNPKKTKKIPDAFQEKYKPVSYEVINPDNFWSFVRLDS